MKHMLQNQAENRISRKAKKNVKHSRSWPCNCEIHVCQIRVMTEFETITLTQLRVVDIKKIAVFRCDRQERISIRGSVRPSVRPSVGPSVRMSVRYASAKTAVLDCL